MAGTCFPSNNFLASGMQLRSLASNNGSFSLRKRSSKSVGDRSMWSSLHVWESAKRSGWLMNRSCVNLLGGLEVVRSHMIVSNVAVRGCRWLATIRSNSNGRRVIMHSDVEFKAGVSFFVHKYSDNSVEVIEAARVRFRTDLNLWQLVSRRRVCGLSSRRVAT